MKEFVKLLEDYIDFVQTTEMPMNLIDETDEVINKLNRLKRKYDLPL